MLFDWFNASKSKEFGITLANFYAEREKKTESGNKGKKEFERKQKELLLKMEQKIIEFKRQNKLNVYKKAQLGNVFKWQLLEIGYTDQYVDDLTQWLMHHLK